MQGDSPLNDPGGDDHPSPEKKAELSNEGNDSDVGEKNLNSIEQSQNFNAHRTENLIHSTRITNLGEELFGGIQ